MENIYVISEYFGEGGITINKSKKEEKFVGLYTDELYEPDKLIKAKNINECLEKLIPILEKGSYKVQSMSLDNYVDRTNYNQWDCYYSQDSSIHKCLITEFVESE